MSDAVVAREAGVCRQAVYRFRVSRGIGRPPFRPRHPSRLVRWHEVLGTVTDADLARRLGMSANAVGKYRRRHGIPRFGAVPPPVAVPPVEAAAPIPVPPAPAPVVEEPPPPVASAPMFAWRVRLHADGGPLARVVLAATLDEALAKGRAAGEVVAVERLDEVLPG